MNNDKIKLMLLYFVIFCGIVRIIYGLNGRESQVDFSHYYVTSKVLLGGDSPYTTALEPYYSKYNFSLDRSNHHATFAPSLGWLFVPFANFGQMEGFVYWQIFQFGCLLLVLIIIKKIFTGSMTNEMYYILIGTTLFSGPIYYHFYFSQIQLMLFALVVLAYYMNKLGYYSLSIVTVTIAGMIKIFPLVLVPWFILRSPVGAKCRVILCLESAFVVLTAIYITDFNLWRDFVSYGLDEIVRFTIGRSSNYSIPSFVINLFYVIYGPPSVDSFHLRWINMSPAAGVLFIALTYFMVIFKNYSKSTEFSVLLISMIIGGVTCWVHYLVFLLFPVSVAFLSDVIRSRIKYKMVLYIIISLVFSSGPHVVFGNSVIFNVLFSYLPLYAMVAFIFLLLRVDHFDLKLQCASIA